MPCVPRRVWRKGLAAVLPALLSIAATSSAQTGGEGAPLVSRTEFGVLPEEGPGSLWARIGGAPAFVIGGQELVLNDNTQGDYVAYQALVGQIRATDRVRLAARVRVLSNIGGLGALIEISRPGLERVVQLYPDHIEVYERAQGRTMHWLGGAPAALATGAEVVVTKASSSEDPNEALVVTIDGLEVLRVAGREEGELGLGRVVFGSLGYGDFGATGWTWVELRVDPMETGGRVAVESSTVGALKGRYRR